MKEYVVYENPLCTRLPVEMFLDKIDVPIVIGPCAPGVKYKFHASLKGTELKINKSDGFLRSSVEFGETPKEACLKLLNSIQGKRLVIDAMSSTRREYDIPYFSNIDAFVEKMVK